MNRTAHRMFLYTVLFRMFALTILVSPGVSGQSNNHICFPASKDVYSGSHLFCAPYRDLNPFNDIPGEVNQWGWGTVYLHTGDSATGRYLLYNALGSNLLWLKNGKESVVLVDKTTVKGFSFVTEKDNRLLKYVYFPVNDWYYADGDGAFLEELVRDSLSLYELNTIEKFPMSTNLKEHRYYFIQKRKEEELTRIRSTRKSLCKALDDDHEFRKYLISIHLRVNKRDRMIRAVQEYNRLY